MTAIRFDHVDVIFGTHTKEALKLLDQGLGRAEILKRTGQVLGVEDACLDVNRGEICVLMGLSGSGKSSLLRCINGLNKVSRGKLLIEHEGSQVDIANCSPATLKAMRTKRIAMVFQKFALMPWLTVAENVGFGLEMQGRPAAERKKLIDEARAGRSLAVARQASRLALRRHAAARRPGSRAGDGWRHPADGRTVLRPRPADPPAIAGRTAGAATATAQDHRVRQPRPRRGAEDRHPHRDHEGRPDHPARQAGRDRAEPRGRLRAYLRRPYQPAQRAVRPESDAWPRPVHPAERRDLLRPGPRLLDRSQRGDVLKGARQGSNVIDLQRWRQGDPVEKLRREPTLVDVSIRMRDALQIRYQTGHKLVLQEQDRVVGVLGDSELYHALLGKNLG